MNSKRARTGVSAEWSDHLTQIHRFADQMRDASRYMDLAAEDATYAQGALLWLLSLADKVHPIMGRCQTLHDRLEQCTEASMAAELAKLREEVKGLTLAAEQPDPAIAI